MNIELKTGPRYFRSGVHRFRTISYQFFLVASLTRSDRARVVWIWQPSSSWDQDQRRAMPKTTLSHMQLIFGWNHFLGQNLSGGRNFIDGWRDVRPRHIQGMGVSLWWMVGGRESRIVGGDDAVPHPTTSKPRGTSPGGRVRVWPGVVVCINRTVMGTRESWVPLRSKVVNIGRAAPPPVCTTPPPTPTQIPKPQNWFPPSCLSALNMMWLYCAKIKYLNPSPLCSAVQGNKHMTKLLCWGDRRIYSVSMQQFYSSLSFQT